MHNASENVLSSKWKLPPINCSVKIKNKMLNIIQQLTDVVHFVFLVTLPFGVALGKIYFEEEFNDDLWSQRWVASKHVAKNFGTYRTAGHFFANANNTGLKTSNDKRLYYFSTLFPEFTNGNKNLVLQYSVKYEQDIGEGEACAEAQIKLFNCNLDPLNLSGETPFLIMFGPDICDGDQKFHVVFTNNNYTSKEKKKISWKYDAFTHMYTLIVQPNKTFSVLIDDVEVSSGVIRDRPTYPRICGIGFQLWQEHSGTIFDNILVTDELAVAKEKRKSIGDWQAAEHRMENVPQEEERERSDEWRKKTHEERKAEMEARKKAREEKEAALIEAARKAEEDGHAKLMLTIYISASLAVLAIVIVIISAYLVFRYRSKYLLTREEVNKFMRGNPDVERHYENEGIVEGSGMAENQPYNKNKYEISTSSFKIDTTRFLGTGEFGSVCLGYIERGDEQVNVAVKMTNQQQGANNLALKGLISEIKILSYVGEHEHILKLEGAYTAKLRMGKVYLFLELCELGSLEKKLRAYKPEQKILNEYANLLRVPLKQEAIEMGVRNQLLLSEEMSRDLDRWSKEIVSAMEYLASKRIVHADLATRNVLLNARKCVKIADFGLSRRLYTYTEYQKSESEPLPWRWMAPESLRKLTFNEKTDVWAFAVTLWEMFTLGDTPYPGLSWDVNFATSLEQGLSLPEPKYNQGNIYSVMKRCWEIMPADRPTFSELKSILA